MLGFLHTVYILHGVSNTLYEMKRVTKGYLASF